MERLLEAGDIVWVNLDPVTGTEQAGGRPAIILTEQWFQARNERSIVCPITSNLSPWPTKVFLPASMRTRGAILVDQVRALDRSNRGFRLVEHAPAEVLAEVRTILAAILGMET